jgi:hypothetical protein
MFIEGLGDWGEVLPEIVCLALLGFICFVGVGIGKKGKSDKENDKNRGKDKK